MNDFLGTFLYYKIWIHDFSYCMYTFDSSIIKCNYLYFVVYTIAIVYLHIRCRTCTCRTYSEPMRHLFRNDASHMNLWDMWFLNCPTYFGLPKNGDRCMLSDVCLCVSFIRDFSSVTLLFSDTPISGVWSENNRVMLLKSRMKDTQGRHQITRDDRYS
jgi:hypothetical protein